MRPFSAVQGTARLMGSPRMGVGPFPVSRISSGPELGQPADQVQADKQTSEIDSIVREIAVEIKLRADRLVGELEISQSSGLSVGIPFIGHDFSPPEIAGQVVLVSSAMVDVINSILSGPLWHYASEDVNKSLDESRSLLEALENQAKPISQPIAHGHEGLAEEHLLSYIEDLKALRDSAERLLVSTEKAPQVLEPAEKEIVDASGLLWAIGALSIGAILVALVASD